ncbi:UNVERIFIED_CONTAM: hypothetical protein NY603_40705, partial [Bacteroidetes bacterium 56_B9]
TGIVVSRFTESDAMASTLFVAFVAAFRLLSARSAGWSTVLCYSMAKCSCLSPLACLEQAKKMQRMKFSKGRRIVYTL